MGNFLPLSGHTRAPSKISTCVITAVVIAIVEIAIVEK